MKEKEKQQVAVERSPTRCPYCHDECTSEDENVACHECLARHHQACWEEAGRCSSCSSERRMEAVALPALTRTHARKLLREAGYPLSQVQAVLDVASGTQQAALNEAITSNASALLSTLGCALICFLTTYAPLLPTDLLYAGLAALVLPLLTVVIARSSRRLHWAVITPILVGAAAYAGAIASPELYSSRVLSAATAFGVPLAVIAGFFAALWRPREPRPPASESLPASRDQT